MEQAINELIRSSRRSLTAQAEQIFLDNAAILPLYENGVTGAVQLLCGGLPDVRHQLRLSVQQPSGTQVNSSFEQRGARRLFRPRLPAYRSSKGDPALKRYILKRLVISLITIWLIATYSFFLLHALPGTPSAPRS